MAVNGTPGLETLNLLLAHMAFSFWSGPLVHLMTPVNDHFFLSIAVKWHKW